MDERQSLIDALKHSRTAIQELLDVIDSNRKIYPLWTVREIVAHISGWDDAMIASIKAHVDGREPGTPAARGIDYYNAQTVSTREGLDYDHIYREFVQTRKDLVALIQSMPETKLGEPFILPWGDAGTVKAIVNIFTEHEEEHAADLRKIISDAKS